MGVRPAAYKEMKVCRLVIIEYGLRLRRVGGTDV